jgi:hypothetical protein
VNVIVENLGEVGQAHLLQALIRNALRKMTSSMGLLEEEAFASSLPLIQMLPLSEERMSYCIVLVSAFQVGIERFFHEMVSRWLIPGKKLPIFTFVNSVFSLQEGSAKKFSFCEARFVLETEQDLERISLYFPQWIADLELGAMSSYQAHKVLEHRGFFSSQKNSLIQERISALVQRDPQHFDYDLFGQMQHFFVSSSEAFKQTREPIHLSRLIAIFYLFRKSLKRRMEKLPDQRQISFKTGQVRLHRPFGLEKALGVFIGINFLKDHEVFEEKHLVKALQEQIPNISLVQGSFFMYLHREEKIQILYLEIQKEDGLDFSKEEILSLRKRVPFTLEKQIEKLMPTLFMPRNEEEVMKNIVRLGQELKYLKDLPQVIISFEEQTDAELSFTVILVRILLKKEPSIQTLFEGSCCPFIFIEDRVRKVGLMRGKYEKEATVFRLKLLKKHYLRSDHSVDLIKARNAVSESLEKVIGEFRDYNGGMLAKQMENLERFKTLVRSDFFVDDWELDKFFHAIFPIEMRMMIKPILLKTLYDLWQKKRELSSFEELTCSFELECRDLVFMARCMGEEKMERISLWVQQMGLSPSQVIRFSWKEGGHVYLGHIFLNVDPSRVEVFLSRLKSLETVSV